MQKLSTGQISAAEASQPSEDANARLSSRCQKESFSYKEVDGHKIIADVYWPKTQPSNPLSIAFTIHGGGHVMPSRTAIRAHQILYLLDQGILSVSIDYRFGPEVSILEGTIPDVVDALSWVHAVLPELAKQKSIVIEVDRTVAIGYSTGIEYPTGGQLAMLLCIEASKSGITPPAAVLSFCSLVDYRTVADAYTLSFLLRGIQPGQEKREMLSEKEIARLSPLHELEVGQYKTPTFLIHGDEDRFAALESSEQFVNLCKKRGIKAGLRVVKGATYDSHDLSVGSDSEELQPGYDFLLDLLR